MRQNIAVVTADIVNSTKVSSDYLLRVLTRLKDLLSSRNILHNFYRGDSIQLVCKPEEALYLGMLMRLLLLESDDMQVALDLRFAIGIGQGDITNNDLSVSQGSAFVLSGRELDELSKSTARLRIKTEDAVVNLGLDALSLLIDHIGNKWSKKQVEVLFALLHDKKQDEIATALGKSQPTVNRISAAANWHLLNRAMSLYKQLIKDL